MEYGRAHILRFHTHRTAGRDCDYRLTDVHPYAGPGARERTGQNGRMYVEYEAVEFNLHIIRRRQRRLPRRCIRALPRQERIRHGQILRADTQIRGG